jgi:MATE family multidrug resistance protein
MSALAVLGTVLLACAPALFAAALPASTSQHAAGRFAQLLAPSILPWVLYLCIQKFLIAQGIVWPCVIVSASAACLNVGLNVWLVGAYGLEGSPSATSLSRVLQLLLLLTYTLVIKPHKANGTWKAPTLKQVFGNSRVFRAMAVLAAGGLFMTAAEAWAFDMTVIFSGYLHDAIALDAHTVMLNLCGLAFASLAFSISIGGSVRVGTLLGEGQPSVARLAAAVCIATGAVCMSLVAVVFITAGGAMARVFTDDEDVIRQVGTIAWAAGVFQIQDGIQACCAGVLRGMGRQVQVAVINTVCFWLIGTPFGLIMTFSPGNLGILGLWLGLLLALSCMNAVYAVVLWRADWAAAAKAAQERTKGGEGDLLSEGRESPGAGSYSQLPVAGHTAEPINKPETSATAMLQLP